MYPENGQFKFESDRFDAILRLNSQQIASSHVFTEKRYAWLLFEKYQNVSQAILSSVRW